MTLILGQDIRVRRTSRVEAYIQFEIRNLERVGEFLENQRQMAFLSDPIVANMPQQHGCNLAVQLCDDEGDRVLHIGRKMGPNALAPAACMDLLSSIRTYIMPQGASDPEHRSYQEWTSVAAGLSPYGQPTRPEAIPLKNLARGREFVQEPQDQQEARIVARLA